MLGLFCRFFDPQEAHLGAEVKPVPDVGEEEFRVTGGAGRHTGPVRHRVVMDVFRQDPTFLEEDSGRGSLVNVSFPTDSPAGDTIL